MKRILNLLVLLMAMMPVMAETVLFEGSTTVEYGSVSVNIDGSLFADAVAGDIVTVEGEKLDAEAAGWWWQMTININDPWTKIAEMGDEGLPVTYTLTADDITKIQGSGLQIQGHAVTVKKVTLTSGYEDVALSVADMQLPWDGTKDATEKSCTFGDVWSENYWTVAGLSTDIYTRVDLTFAQPVNYYKVRVKAVYSDNSETDTEITYGAESHSVKLTAGKRLVKLAMKQYDQKNLNGGATVKLYFDDIIIRTAESAAAVTPKTWTSSFKLGTDRANPLLDFHYIADPTAIEYNGRLYVYGTNDHQQYEAGTASNTYEAINSLVVISTDDMVNWTYHGLIDTKGVWHRGLPPSSANRRQTVRPSSRSTSPTAERVPASSRPRRP